MQQTSRASDTIAKRNIATVLGFYDLMINRRQPLDATKKYLASDYIQHNPLIPTGAEALAAYFTATLNARPKLRVVVHRIIAEADQVWAHVNFINLHTDDDGDRGVAGVDIYRFNAEGKVVEHWDVLQPVPASQEAANANGMF
jgi:predicted SnoaL-like aldol condensation-catalyzing enzyme